MQDYLNHEMGLDSNYFTFALINPNLSEPDRYLAPNLVVLTKNDVAIFGLVALDYWPAIDRFGEIRSVSYTEDKNDAESSLDDTDEMLSNWSNDSLFTADTASFEVENDQLIPEVVENKCCKFMFKSVLNIVYGLFTLLRFMFNNWEHCIVWTGIGLLVFGCHLLVLTINNWFNNRVDFILKTLQNI